jgi:hypothetical protein
MTSGERKESRILRATDIMTDHPSPPSNRPERPTRRLMQQEIVEGTEVRTLIEQPITPAAQAA